MPRGTGKRFDGNAWYEQYITARTTEALEEKEREFARAHAGTPAHELIGYVRRCADEMGYTPTMKEVIGGAYIARRFGGWPAVLKEAQLAANHGCLPLTKRYIFRREREIQAALHRRERSEKLRAKELKNRRRSRKTAMIADSPLSSHAEEAPLSFHRAGGVCRPLPSSSKSGKCGKERKTCCTERK